MNGNHECRRVRTQGEARDDSGIDVNRNLAEEILVRSAAVQSVLLRLFGFATVKALITLPAQSVRGRSRQ